MRKKLELNSIYFQFHLLRNYLHSDIPLLHGLFLQEPASTHAPGPRHNYLRQSRPGSHLITLTAPLELI